jgi:hypothetical protein
VTTRTQRGSSATDGKGARWADADLSLIVIFMVSVCLRSTVLQIRHRHTATLAAKSNYCPPDSRGPIHDPIGSQTTVINRRRIPF